MESNIDRNYQLEIPEQISSGNYSNLAIISHSSSEFVIDFAKMAPGFRKPEVCDRVILAPEHAKRLLLALQDNVSKYEHSFGPIKLQQTGKPQQKPIAPFDINKGEA